MCELWLCHNAISSSPTNSLPVYILHQGSSMFGARWSRPVVYRSEIELFFFLLESYTYGICAAAVALSTIGSLWGILWLRFVRKACRWCERTPDTLLTHALTRWEVTTWELRETGEQLISGISTCVIRVIYKKKRTQRPVRVHNNTSEAVEGKEKERRGQEVMLEKCPQRHRKEELVTVSGLDLHEMQRDLAL